IDAGVGVYTQKTFSPERYEIWNMQSSFHNLPAINGCQQCNGSHFCAQNIQYQSDEQSMNVSMEIDQAYHPDAGLKLFVRRFHFQRTVPSITIEDQFEFIQDNHSLCQYLMCLQKPIQTVPGNLSVPAATDAALQITYDSAYSVSIEEIILQDPRLKKSWGEQLYRVHFFADNLPSKVNFRFVIRKKQALPLAVCTRWGVSGNVEFQPAPSVHSEFHRYKKAYADQFI
ncbi:MAG: hypothetical protein ACRDBO_03595, partial [Lachnospiraceae bacterium]